MQKRDQIYESLKNDILGGKYRLGSCLPKEVDFAEKLGISRKTLRYALERLQEDGLIDRLRSKGTFIRFKRYLVLADCNDSIHMPFNYIIPGIIRAAEKKNISLSISSFQEFENLTGKEICTGLEKQQITGCIVITNKIDENTRIWQQMKDISLPVVLAHGHPSDHVFTGWPTAAFDERNAWKAAFLYLKSLGHRRIAAGCGKPCFEWIRGWKQNEFLSMLSEIGLDAAPSLIYYIARNGENADREASRLLQMPNPPTAFVCYSDFHAPVLYRALEKRGLRIPEDISVMGFCGAPMGCSLSPSLSTIDLQYLKIGETAVEMLDDPGPEALRFIDFRLEVRESTNQK